MEYEIDIIGGNATGGNMKLDIGGNAAGNMKLD
jgi:hypothetical protein